ncbi:uncharacterized protein ACLA_065290 [Aspergillus clavatus NRRL 1]|uniref:Uncharacterized protein n=1 Tax=Aspergillus clavatus (strain ATCC 1007 / CBS 513.65 / DSM 816 / NCTC 3887 / NRRL 1 / QM 1276 / 107) TaxID=344612 RepID=A1CG15_ASPCL|nr:uncharacterized protein ACLA_065290 [Aspergillus clavatus NRRL 1]EAW10895.1 conserved hypothetical protein [Aspergillus clavatus NRRL 1]
MPRPSLVQLPILATFIPSLPPNTPFRVSVHSWEKPRPSLLTESLMQPDDALLFEVRIFIDGLCVSIRVVIAEGLARPNRNPPIERVKDVVAFSFQHAPLQVLEYSNIAWPNAGMWNRGKRMFKYNAGSLGSGTKEQEDLHGHSPSRPENRGSVTLNSQVSNPALYTTWQQRNYPPLPPPQWQNKEATWAPQESFMVDPFIDPYVLDPAARHRGARPSWEDIIMPDYISNSSSSRAFSSMTGISYEHSKQPSLVAPIDEESYNQLIEGVSPPKPLACSTQASTNAAPAAPPMATKLSSAAEERSSTYVKKGRRPSVLKELSQTETRSVSGSSVKSNLPSEGIIEATTTCKLHVSPNTHVKSRKEGITSDNKENDVSGETSRQDHDKIDHTPTKIIVRTSGNVETPNESQRRLSTNGSAHGGVSLAPEKETPVLLPPSKNLSEAGDHDPSAGFDDFLDSRLPLADPVVQSLEID